MCRAATASGQTLAGDSSLKTKEELVGLGDGDHRWQAENEGNFFQQYVVRGLTPGSRQASLDTRPIPRVRALNGVVSELGVPPGGISCDHRHMLVFIYSCSCHLKMLSRPSCDTLVHRWHAV